MDKSDRLFDIALKTGTLNDVCTGYQSMQLRLMIIKIEKIYEIHEKKIRVDDADLPLTQKYYNVNQMMFHPTLTEMREKNCCIEIVV